ncbi:metal ABC transporter permease [Aquisalimonas asiatica]|uniref:Zinc transport system permease protein n=1 Tax=Aquisalimonas asiatica TaxID=406100 RepID=A0A1H8VCG4_9GAMM|nr:metal ABC transporter permease [Aquisalimonas asiatica]SEP12934.1 zinc transport system permease protein [Aquisalimonas asiatica]
MSELLALLNYEFARNALMAAVLASVLAGTVGTFVVVKRLVFIAGGISHAAFAGLGFFYWLGGNPLTGAVVVAVLAALLLGWLGEHRARSQDALIGVLWAGGMATGIVFIHLTPGYTPDLMTYLFGDILTVSRADVYLLAALTVGVIVVMALFYRTLVAVAFDETFAAVQGAPVKWMTTLLLVLVALSVIMLIQVVGIVLLIALFTIPPMIALMLAQRFIVVLGIAVAAGLITSTGGLAGSYWLDLPSGPAIVLFGIIALVLVRGWTAVTAAGRRASGAG